MTVSPGTPGPGRERLSDQAYRQIRDAIISLTLQPGSPLDEKSISSWLGIGLTPVREALRRLTLEKLAASHPGRGVYVSPIDITDESQLTEVRIQLEGLAAALAAERATAEQKAGLLALLADLEIEHDDRANHTELDGRVHRAIYVAAHNSYLETTLNQYADLALRIWNLSLRGEPVELEHILSQRAVIEAIVRGDPQQARLAAEQHLRGFSDSMRSVMHE